MDAKECLKRHEQLARTRQLDEPQMRELAQFFRPEHRDAWTGGRRSTSGHEELYDATHLQALEAFAGGMFSQLTSNAQRWFELSLMGGAGDAPQPVQAWLRACADTIYMTLSPASSRFYAEMPGFYMDLGAYGYAAIYQQHVGGGRFIDRAIAAPELYFGCDANGAIVEVHRKFRLKGAQIKAAYGPVDAARDEQDYTLIHCVFQNPDHVPGSRFTRALPWASVTVSPDLQEFERRSGYHELPYAVAMWNRAPGRPYPTGPGHVALPDVRMLQEMERVHLAAAQLAAEPPIMADDEATVAVQDLIPRNVLYGTMTDAGKAKLQPLNMVGDLRLSDAKSQQRREAVKDVFAFNLMTQLAQRPQMTATEFIGFRDEKLRLLAPNLARVQADALTPFIARRYAELDRLGMMPPPPPDLQDGQGLDVSYVSPLAKVMQGQEGQATLQWLEAIGQLAQFDPSAVDNVDPDAAANVLHGAFGPPPSVKRAPRAIEQIRAARAQAQGQQTQIDQSAQLTTIAAEQAHAEQAMTLAAQRGAGR
jgi:hypothetical protein